MTLPEYIFIPTLHDIDALELEEDLPLGSLHTERVAAQRNDGEHGDFGLTAAIVALTVNGALFGLSTWIAKRRGHEKTVTDITATKEADGRIYVHYHESKDRSFSEAPDPAVIKAIHSRLTDVLEQLQP